MKFGETLQSTKELAAAGELDVVIFVDGEEILRRPQVDLDSEGDVALYFSFEAPNYQAYSRKA